MRGHRYLGVLAAVVAFMVPAAPAPSMSYAAAPPTGGLGLTVPGPWTPGASGGSDQCGSPYEWQNLGCDSDRCERCAPA